MDCYYAVLLCSCSFCVFLIITFSVSYKIAFKDIYNPGIWKSKVYFALYVLFKISCTISGGKDLCIYKLFNVANKIENSCNSPNKIFIYFTIFNLFIIWVEYFPKLFQ